MNNVSEKYRTCVEAQFKNAYKNKLYLVESKGIYHKRIRNRWGLRSIEMFIFYLIMRR